jgi:hypothetical protein
VKALEAALGYSQGQVAALRHRLLALHAAPLSSPTDAAPSAAAEERSAQSQRALLATVAEPALPQRPAGRLAGAGPAPAPLTPQGALLAEARIALARRRVPTLVAAAAAAGGSVGTSGSVTVKPSAAAGSGHLIAPLGQASNVLLAQGMGRAPLLCRLQALQAGSAGAL